MASTVTTTTQTSSPVVTQNACIFPPGTGRRLKDDDQELEANCPVCPPVPRPNHEIRSISVDESNAFPQERYDPQPSYWNAQLRGNPPYRSQIRDQDYSTRPLGSNRIEYTFLCFMLSGVMLQNWTNMAWRGTVGRLTDRIFRFRIGGTW